MLADAEVIKAACDAVHTIDELQNVELHVRISHTDLFQASIEHVGASSADFAQLMPLLLEFTSIPITQRDVRTRAWASFCQFVQVRFPLPALLPAFAVLSKLHCLLCCVACTC
jgi:ATP phosphoribosyltransferase regulatory subunit HisZ